MIRLLLGGILALSGCADWFEADTCGGPRIHLALDPAMTCLDLAGGAVRNGQPDRIVGKNNCAQTLVVGSGSYPPGADISIELDDGAASQQGNDTIWTLQGTLGSQTLTITATKAPC